MNVSAKSTFGAVSDTLAGATIATALYSVCLAISLVVGALVHVGSLKPLPGRVACLGVVLLYGATAHASGQLDGSEEELHGLSLIYLAAYGLLVPVFPLRAVAHCMAALYVVRHNHREG